MMSLRYGVILVSVLVMGLSACSRNEPINPPTPLQEIKPKVSLTSVWNQSLGSLARNDLPGLKVLEQDGKVYAAASSGGVALLSLDGQVAWQVNLGQPLVSGPVIDPASALLYVGSAKGELIALKSASGELSWKAALEAEVLAVATHAGLVFARTSDGRLTALSSSTGAKVWVLDHDLPSLSVRGMSAPLVIDQMIVLGWEDGLVEAVRASSGDKLWEARIALPRGRTDIERMIDVQSTLVTDGVRIFASATNGKLSAIESQSGNLLWNADLSTWVDMASQNQQLFVVAEDDTLRAVSADNGRVLWKQDALKYRRVSKAVAWDKWVLVSDAQGVLHVLDASDGSLVGRVDSAVKAGLVDAKALSDRRLVLLDANGSLSLWQAGKVE